jgi:hypothetical protein
VPKSAVPLIIARIEEVCRGMYAVNGLRAIVLNVIPLADDSGGGPAVSLPDAKTDRGRPLPSP